MRNSRREANVVRSDSYHLSAHQRATLEKGRVGIWAVVFWKNPVIKWKGGGRCGTPGGRQMWYGVIRTTSLNQRATLEKGRVGIWAVVF